MPRPQKDRLVNRPPLFNSFKPTGIAKRQLNTVRMSLDEFEAVRLADYEGLEHVEAANLMNISRSTFTRLVEKARKKAATAIVEGCELLIDGGNVHFRGNIIRCNDCGDFFRVDLDRNTSKCMSCGSENITDMASGYGHGRCCRKGGRA